MLHADEGLCIGSECHAARMGTASVTMAEERDVPEMRLSSRCRSEQE